MLGFIMAKITFLQQFKMTHSENRYSRAELRDSELNAAKNLSF